jgi:hypothetical protein
MICPNCKCEYIRSVTQCADCGVALVDALEPEETPPEGDLRVVEIWRGNDLVQFERVQGALEAADIPFRGQRSSFNNSFITTEPTREIWVPATDWDRAKKAILDLDERIDPSELTPEQIESLALPESDQLGEDETNRIDDLGEDWCDDDPGTEVWSGDSQLLADTLIVCLREVGISSRKGSKADRWSVEVRPGQESRAKEIVREVVEASPPE